MILVTGASGQVGSAVLKALPAGAPVRAVSRSGQSSSRPDLDWTAFDFADPASFTPALAGVSAVFLMRPPHMANAKAFKPFLDACTSRGVDKLVLLSVKGAGNNPLLPHHGLERLVHHSGIRNTILRPGDFMQNLETVHARSIRQNNEIAVPAGKGRSAFVDVADVGEAAAHVLTYPGFENQAFDLTGPEALSFSDVAAMLSEALGRTITYRSPGLLPFIREQQRLGHPVPLALVMSALYTVQKLGFAAEITDGIERILQRPPTAFRHYAVRAREHWQPV